MGGDLVRKSYSDLLSESINNSGLKLQKIIDLIFEKDNIKFSKEYISRLKNGKIPPASDTLNEALASVLNIDPLQLKVAAYLEKIPSDVLDHLSERKEVI